MIARRRQAIAPGHENGNVHQDRRKDELLDLGAGSRGESLATPVTPSRRENSVSRRDLAALSRILVHVFPHCHEKGPEAILLHLDTTADPVHGNQEGRGSHGFQDHGCFLQFCVLCGDVLPAAHLRPSVIDAASQACAELDHPVERTRSVRPQAGTVVAGGRWLPSLATDAEAMPWPHDPADPVPILPPAPHREYPGHA